jgi:hypothetical protein
LQQRRRKVVGRTCAASASRENVHGVAEIRTLCTEFDALRKLMAAASCGKKYSA